jgi:DNA-binding response OmpR family regulator
MNGGFKEHERVKGSAAVLRKCGVLIADEKALILTLLKVELESRGFAVWLAMDGDDAIDLYRSHRDEIDLVLLDVQMPGLDGPHTLEALKRLNPAVVTCFMTGKGGVYTEQDLLGRGAAWVFSKPFRLAEVGELLEKFVSSAHYTPRVGDRKASSEREIPPCTLPG